MTIPFNKPYLTGREVHFIYDAVATGKLSGNGKYTQLVQNSLRQHYNFGKCLLTTSCTDALEMSAILLNIEPGDEVIAPAYTFVSTVNAFVLRGAHIRFADSTPKHPNLDPAHVETLITPRTKAIVVVHYAGVACDMVAFEALCSKYGLALVEDAAQAIDSYHNGRSLGSIGDLAAFSFHETKNIIAGEGGMLVVNRPDLAARAEIIWEKGTNRAAFFRGEVDKYGWVDVGSSFLPSELVAAFLHAQVLDLRLIQNRRIELWQRYAQAFEQLEQSDQLRLPYLPEYATNNAHMFYLLCKSLEERQALIGYLRERGILAVFHYLSLHTSPYYQDKYDGGPLPWSDYYTDHLLRLPLYCGLENAEQDLVIETVLDFYQN